ncbi:hypothetical protein GCM10022222_44290 [Amycolatopsis ultiminotia]|uniref:LapA family protein n=1 Tax=Amycolatopsis ultiminotia TaxID=543629 RepID=A0ABP6WSU8_9PSEU
MLWLFGQIWLWLLVSFLLGAAVMWLLTRATRTRAPAEPEPVRPAAEPAAPAEAEQTQYLPPATHHDSTHYDAQYYDDEPERVYNDYPEVDPDEPYPPLDSGGYPLPDPEPRMSGELDWPAGDEEPDRWPHEDEPAPRRPGRGG